MGSQSPPPPQPPASIPSPPIPEYQDPSPEPHLLLPYRRFSQTSVAGAGFSLDLDYCRSNKILYTNAIEFWYDACLWALRKAGAADLKVVIGKFGWPTDGLPGASEDSASRFYESFLPYIHSGKGTPLRPGPIDGFVHSLVDENVINISHASSDRHNGIYRFNGIPKYPIYFSGQGRPYEFPPNAIGILVMPFRWCVFNGNYNNPDLVKKWFDFAAPGARGRGGDGTG